MLNNNFLNYNKVHFVTTQNYYLPSKKRILLSRSRWPHPIIQESIQCPNGGQVARSRYFWLVANFSPKRFIMRKSPYIFFTSKDMWRQKHGTKSQEARLDPCTCCLFLLQLDLLANCMCTCHVSIYLENYVVHIYIGDRIVVFIC